MCKLDGNRQFELVAALIFEDQSVEGGSDPALGIPGLPREEAEVRTDRWACRPTIRWPLRHVQRDGPVRCRLMKSKNDCS